MLPNINMPRLNGFGVLKKMRQEERTSFVPVVMLTSSNHLEDVCRAYELGANGYLDKLSDGVRWDEMVRVVGEGMGGHEAAMCLAGSVSSTVVGYLAIRLLLRFLANHTLRVFVYYPFAVGAVVALVLLTAGA